MQTEGLISEAALQRVLAEADSPQVRNWVLAVLAAIREQFPRCDFYVLNRSSQSEDEPRIYIGVGARQPNTASGRNALILVAKNNTAYLGFQRKGQFDEKYRARVSPDRLSAKEHTDLAEVKRWLEQLDLALDAEDRRALQGEARTVDDYLNSDTPMSVATAGADAPSAFTVQPSLNQILFGPPGTGKTYNTINQALAILTPEFLAQNSGDDAETRKRLKDEFDRFVTTERVRFVTFHQSFSYEDFVEGLRADSDPETGQVKYPIEAGIFKRICDDARTRPATDLGVRANPALWKISIAGTGASPTKSYCLANGEARIGWGNTGDLREGYEQNAYYQQLGGGDKGTLNYFAEQMAVGDILLCIHSAERIGSIGVVTSDYRYEQQVPPGVIADYQHVRSVRWLYRDINLSILPLNDGRQFTLKTVYAMSRFTWADLLSYLQQQGVQPVEPVAATAAADEPYVLIIDEINRGNVSRIFGELITLIEPSKREGADEALSLKLPYSKKPFSVPKNVYLIGTMNTADRSLAGLDIALRRRFVFREMPPRPELLDDVQVAGLNIGQLLRVMNQRIEVLLDRDHCLGHAYFVPLKEEATIERLEVIFRNQILPLLQEYFFEDWQRIQWVLNDHRKAALDQFVQQRDSSVEALFGQEIGQGLERNTWSLNDEAFERLEAYLGIVDHQLQARVAVVKQEASHGDILLRELASGSIEVLRSGVRQEPSKPVLRELADQLGIGTLNSSGNLLNTRSLGRQLINQLRNVNA